MFFISQKLKYRNSEALVEAEYMAVMAVPKAIPDNAYTNGEFLCCKQNSNVGRAAHTSVKDPIIMATI